MPFILTVLAVLSLSFIKYLIGVSLAIKELTEVQGFIVVSCGASLSVIFYVYGGDKLIAFLKKRRKLKQANSAKQTRKFTKWNRFLIKIKRNGGLPIIALLAPVIISIPVGCLLALSFIHDKRKIVGYMIGSILLWSLMIFGFKSILLSIYNLDIPK